MFRQRKNKRFNYQQRFSKDNTDVEDLDDPKKAEFVSKWRDSKSTKLKSTGGMRLNVLLVVLVLLLICMFWLESKIN